MNLKRLLLVARKTLLETLRDPILLVLLLGLPAFFMLVNYVGYGYTPKTATYPLLILSNTGKTEPLTDKLAAAVYSDGRPCFSLSVVSSRDEAEIALQERTVAVLLILEEDSTGKIHYTTRGDALYMNFIKASAQLEAIIIPWLEREQGKPERFSLQVRPLDRPRPISEFDTYVPGMMVFAILLIIPQTAMLIGRERRWGTLRRLNLSLLRPAELLGGICLAQLVVASVQVVLMFAAALALGFHNRGPLLLALGIGVLLAFGSVGLGLLLGCFMRTDTDALNTGSAVSMIQVFLSGAFFAMPLPILFTWLEHPIAVFDFIPASHGMLALQQVLVGGAALAEVIFRVAATLLLSLLYFGIGILVYRRFNR
jgi:ABC-2 type transport system permease protein